MFHELKKRWILGLKEGETNNYTDEMIDICRKEAVDKLRERFSR
jgi:Cys-tRNA synthase (O-phospho-L-seryl-tRNA:Cys-tRNA synthase)